MVVREGREEPEDSLVGQLVADRYRVHRRVAIGGMGAIYRATQEPLGRPVALKTHRSLGELEGHVDADAVFLREAAAAAQIRHPNVAEVYDYGQHEGRPFIAMEWLEGETLRQRVRRSGPMEPAEALRIALLILGALERVHELGMVHRDIKPANVVLLESGEPKLLDFGLVQWNDGNQDPFRLDGLFVGSPQFMPPEQISGEGSLDLRADVYAFGGLLYYMLAAAPPFDGSGEELLRRHLEARPKSLRERGVLVSGSLEQLLACCLRKRADDRFADMGQLRAALGACPEAGGSDPREVEEATAAIEIVFEQAPERRPRGRRWVLSLATLAIAGFVVGWWWDREPPLTPVDGKGRGPQAATEQQSSERPPLERTEHRAPPPRHTEPEPEPEPEPIERTSSPARPARRRTSMGRDWSAGGPAPALRDPWADE